MNKIALFLILITNWSIAQSNKIDSLQRIIKNAKNDSVKVDALNKLTWKYIFNDKDKSVELLNRTEKLALKTNQKYGYNTFLTNKGVFFDVHGNSDSAKVYFEKAIAYSVQNKFVVQEEYGYNNLGMYSWNNGEFQTALNYFFKSLKLAQKNHETDSTVKMDGNYNNIGLIYQEMELYEKAIPYHQKALQIRIKRKHVQGEAASYNNLGICYTELKQISKAKEYFKLGLQKATEANDKVLYYNNIQSLAEILQLENDHQKALDLFLESYNRPASMPYTTASKVRTLSGIAAIYLDLNAPQKAIEYGEKCVLEIKNHDTDEVYEINVYKTLAQAYFQTGQLEKGKLNNELFYKKTSQKFKETSAKSLQELEIKYETEMKELALVKAKNENLLKEARIQKKNQIIYGAFGLAFLLAVIGFLVFKQQKLKNTQLAKENDLRQALTKIETQNKLQEQRLEISRELHDNIGSQLTFIISSIDNLKFFNLTKEGILDKYDKISGFTRNTISELRDSIWAMNKEEITFEDLKVRTANFIENAKFSMEGIAFRFTYPSEHELVALNSKTGIYIYRIIQEAVNNAIKHADASKITVDIQVEASSIIFRISDNGKGFDLATVEKNYGIQSIENRAKEIGARVEFRNDQGTQVVLKISNRTDA